jgi:serine protease Do
MDFADRRSGGIRFLPYIFGGLLGVSLGLIILSGMFFFKKSNSTQMAGDDTAGTTVTAGTAGTAGVSGNANAVSSIDESRRNAIVVATERTAPAVVSIASKYTRQVQTYPFHSSIAREWLKQFFRVPDTQTREFSSLGSGVIIHEDGYILTNEHVVHNADLIEVTLSDGTIAEGHIVGDAPDYDLALIKIEGDNLPYAPLGDSDDILVGEWAIAIGQPFGQLLFDTQPTVTVGVISALHRDVKSGANQRGADERIFKDMIQTDAAINPGNSGGPLVDSRGHVIGINTFIFSTGSGGNLGMGFAIPINRGKWVLEEIQRYGRVREVWVGITVREVTPQFAAALELGSARGLLVREIQLESPADKAGVKPGDLITSVNGQPIATLQEANRMIFGLKVGDTLEFEIDRRGERESVTLELEERPNEI